jgi:hypothetical protein
VHALGELWVLSRYEEAFQALNNLRKELLRLRRIEQEYYRLKREYEILLERKKRDGFYFCIGPEVFTGHSAVNFEEFYEAFEKIPLNSIEFHMKRGDFESWLSFINMHELAQEFEKIKQSKLSGNALKQKLLELMEKVVEN